MHDVFISYRNEDGQHFAENIYEHLQKSGCKPFYSERELTGGDEFPSELESKVKECKVLILALTPGVLKGFKDRPHDKDWVYQEIKIALENGKTIIPYKDGESIKLDKDDLPDEINRIADCHALTYNKSQEQPYSKLVNTVKKHVGFHANRANKWLAIAVLSISFIIAIAVISSIWNSLNNPQNYSENAKTEDVIADTTVPTVAISAPIGFENADVMPYVEQGGSLSFRVRFSDNNGIAEINITPNDILMSPGLTAEIDISGNGVTRVVTLKNIQGVYGEQHFSVASGVAKDKSGNINLELQSPIFIIQEASDHTPPNVAISNLSIIDDGIELVVNFSDNNDIAEIHLEPMSIILHGIAGEISIIGNGLSRVIRISDYRITGSGCYVTIQAGAAVDSAGNKSPELNSTSLDLSIPAVTISSPDQDVVKEGSKVIYTVSANDNNFVSFYGIRENDIALVGFSADVEITEVDTYTRRITFSNIVSTDDTISKYFVLSKGVAKDSTGNESTQHFSPAFVISEIEENEGISKDRTPPSMAISRSEISENEILFTVWASDETELKEVTTDSDFIILIGLSGDVTIEPQEDFGKCTVHISNYKQIFQSCSIVVKEGFALDAAGNKSLTIQSFVFNPASSLEGNNE